jgi:spore germination protein GerM
MTTKKEIRLGADRYKSAWKEVMATYPKWKKEMLMEDMQSSQTTSQLKDFIKKVLTLAESNEGKAVMVDTPITPSRVKRVRRKVNKQNKQS